MNPIPNTSEAGESELDVIMEDLIVGHNFDYARKALTEWRDRTGLEERLDEMQRCDKQKIYQGISARPKYAISGEYIDERTAELEAQLSRIEGGQPE